jgi:hypothetical protein
MSMRILILGRGKTGTTGLLFKVAAGLPNCKAFSGGDVGHHLSKDLGADENAVYKQTYSEGKGRTLEAYRDHVAKVNYDRKIWMARDPRDAAVSRMLYRWHKGHWGRGRQYRQHLELVQTKEQDPKSIPFYVLFAYTGRGRRPMTKEELVEMERVRYRHMCDFVASLGSDWFVFRYEDMVDQKFDALHQYLGFKTAADASIPSTNKKAKAARKKAYGDWRHWYTEEDVELFKPVYLPYMKLIGCDCNDWTLSPKPLIEPEFSSRYMQKLVQMNTQQTIRNVKDFVLRPFVKRS